MQFVIHTQFLENYGAHCEDGKWASGNAYWKFKGGETYIVSGLDRMQDAVAFVAAKFSNNDIDYKEFPCEWETFEEWEVKLAELSEDYAEFQRDQAKLVSPLFEQVSE